MFEALQFGITDGLRAMLWWIYVGLASWIDKGFDLLSVIPNLMTYLLNSDFMQSAYTYVAGLTAIVFLILCIFQIFKVVLDPQTTSRWIRNIGVSFVILVSLPQIFGFGINLSTRMSLDTNTLFTSDANSMAVALLNQEISLKDNAPTDDGYSEDPFYTLHDAKVANDSGVLNATYKVDGDRRYYYELENIIIVLLSNIGIFILLIISILKIYSYVGKIILFKIFSPIFTIFIGSTGTFENAAKNYFQTLYKCFLSIFLQFFTIGFSMALMTTALDYPPIEDSFLLWLLVIIGSLIIMLDGSEAFVDMFATDVGINGVVQTYAFSKGLSLGAQGVEAGAKGVGHLASKIDLSNISIPFGKSKDGDGVDGDVSSLSFNGDKGMDNNSSNDKIDVSNDSDNLNNSDQIDYDNVQNDIEDEMLDYGQDVVNDDVDLSYDDNNNMNEVLDVDNVDLGMDNVLDNDSAPLSDNDEFSNNDMVNKFDTPLNQSDMGDENSRMYQPDTGDGNNKRYQPFTNDENSRMYQPDMDNGNRHSPDYNNSNRNTESRVDHTPFKGGDSDYNEYSRNRNQDSSQKYHTQFDEKIEIPSFHNVGENKEGGNDE